MGTGVEGQASPEHEILTVFFISVFLPMLLN